MFLILELESSIFENARKFFWGRFFFIFWGLDWDVRQVVLFILLAENLLPSINFLIEVVLKDLQNAFYLHKSTFFSMYSCSE